MSELRLRFVVRERRTLIPQATLAAKTVEHYSLPAYDERGSSVVANGDEIGSDKLAVSPGQILISKLNPRIPRVQLVGDRRQGCELAVCSTEFVVLEATSADPGYLRWWLGGEAVAGILGAAVKSTTRSQQRVLPEDILNLRVPLADRARQNEIAAFLDREIARVDQVSLALQLPVDRSRELRVRLLLDQLRDLRLPVERLRFGISSLGQGWSPECWERERGPGEWGVLKLGCVNGGEFTPEHKTLPPELAPRPELEVQDGDLLMSRANTRRLVGSAAVVPPTVPPRLMLSDLLYRIRLRPERWHGPFVAAVVNSPIGRAQIEAAAAGSSGSMPKISQEVIRQLRLPRPELDVQVAIAAKYENARRSLNALSSTAVQIEEALAEYRASLIHEAVTGKLDVAQMREPQMEERLHAAREGRLDEVTV